MGPSEHMSSYVESESMKQLRKELICGSLNKNGLHILKLFSNWSQFYGMFEKSCKVYDRGVPVLRPRKAIIWSCETEIGTALVTPICVRHGIDLG